MTFNFNFQLTKKQISKLKTKILMNMVYGIEYTTLISESLNQNNSRHTIFIIKFVTKLQNRYQNQRYHLSL